jgi:hypothetical protein
LIVIPGRERSERTRNFEIPGSRYRAPRNDIDQFFQCDQNPKGLTDRGRDPRRVSRIRSPPLQAELP